MLQGGRAPSRASQGLAEGLAGATGSFVACSLLQPLDFIKTNQQKNPSRTPQSYVAPCRCALLGARARHDQCSGWHM
jgi:hypothetical protein